MNEFEINAVKGLVGSVRGAQLVVSREGVRPQFTLDVITGIEDNKVVVEHIILDAPVKNPAGEDINIFTAGGVSRPAIPSEVFTTNNEEKLKVRKADAKARFLVEGKWGEEYSPAATKAAMKVTISHRIDVTALKAASRPARRKDGEVWTDIPTREVKANLPVGDTRVTFDGIKRYVRLVEGGVVRLLPLPAEAVSSQKATAAGALELE